MLGNYEIEYTVGSNTYLPPIRFAYSGIDKEMITEGIRKLADYIKSKQH